MGVVQQGDEDASSHQVAKDGHKIITKKPLVSLCQQQRSPVHFVNLVHSSINKAVSGKTFTSRKRKPIDSPPIIAVTDSEILTSMVDGTLLVVSSENTEIEMMERSVELIRRENTQFLGTVLNNFSYKSGYGSYYKYYYYYSRPDAKST